MKYDTDCSMASTKAENTAPTRYEDLLLQQRKLYQSFLSSTNKSCLKLGTMAIIVNYATMSGMLQCAVNAVKYQNKSNKDQVEDLTELLENTLREQNFDRDLRITQHDGKRISLGMLHSIATLEDYHDENSPATLGVCHDKILPRDDGKQESDLDEADNFFRDYSQCVRKYVFEVFEDSDDDGNEEARTLSQKTIEGHQRQPINLTVSSPFGTMSKPCSTRSNAAGTDDVAGLNNMEGGNLYRYHEVNESLNQNEWDNYHVKQKQKGNKINHPGNYMLHNKGFVNQFCTAREYKNQSNYDNSMKEDIGDLTESVPNNNLNSKYSQVETCCRETHTPKAQPLVPSHNANRSTLSTGLKRKFQIPKSRKGSNSSNSPSDSVGEKNCLQKQGDEKDDDLPEELKGLDKELVSKIENEIIHSEKQTKVSFEDIAGLKDAKQTVLELVCWPMKRPDLFTGLRRGPNGLLLFGPPGKIIALKSN